MKKFAVLFGTIFVALTLGACSGAAATSASSASTHTELAEASVETDLLGSRKVYLNNPYYGLALDDADAADLVWQSEIGGHAGSQFSMMATDGVEVTDPVSGVTFVLPAGTEEANLSDGAGAYIADGMTLDQLLSGLDESDFVVIGEISTSYGNLTVYRLA